MDSTRCVPTQDNENGWAENHMAAASGAPTAIGARGRRSSSSASPWSRSCNGPIGFQKHFFHRLVGAIFRDDTKAGRGAWGPARCGNCTSMAISRPQTPRWSVLSSGGVALCRVICQGRLMARSSKVPGGESTRTQPSASYLFSVKMR